LPLYAEFHFLEVLLRLLYDPYFHFCYKLALETSAKCSSIKSLRVHDLHHAHILASLQWSGPSDQWMLLSQLKTAYTARNGAPKKLIYACLCQEAEKWPSRCRPTLFYSQPRQLPCAQHPVLKPAHLHLSHLLCYLQNRLRPLITCSQSCMIGTLIRWY